MKEKTAEEIVKQLTDYLNSFSNKGEEFSKQMAREHRTLQQSFTKLCFQWMEYVASDQYQTDLRNQASKEMAVLMLSLLTKHYAGEFTGSSLEIMAKPSGHLSMI